MTEVTCDDAMVGDRVYIYTYPITPIYMCEAEVFGYQHVQCEEYQDNFYHGPACGRNCHCDSQCHLITGRVVLYVKGEGVHEQMGGGGCREREEV